MEGCPHERDPHGDFSDVQKDFFEMYGIVGSQSGRLMAGLMATRRHAEIGMAYGRKHRHKAFSNPFPYCSLVAGSLLRDMAFSSLMAGCFELKFHSIKYSTRVFVLVLASRFLFG